MPEDGTGPPPPEGLAAALDRLMPMHLVLGPDLTVRHAGPTLRRIAGSDLTGRPLTERFDPVHPPALARARDLIGPTAVRLRLRGAAPTVLKGAAAEWGRPGGAVLVNLSFSYGLREAVIDHGLAATDFAATDLAFEMLFLSEANHAVIAAARKASARLRGARAQAVEQALTDPLTGLRNRRGLERGLAGLAARQMPFALVHVDLDRFKQINDTLGHLAGDAVLVEAAQRLRAAVRDADAVARLGGDEFVVLLPGLRDAATVQAVAGRLLADLARPYDLPGVPGQPVSASLGAVLCAGQGAWALDALLAAADRALYASKDAGRGRLTIAPATLTPPGAVS